jgi:biotin carboxylase
VCWKTSAQACQDKGIIFIGPSAQTIAKAGDKSSARQTLIEMDIPVIPGSDDVLDSVGAACNTAAGVGYPVILKASGGPGIRQIMGRCILNLTQF